MSASKTKSASSLASVLLLSSAGFVSAQVQQYVISTFAGGAQPPISSIPLKAGIGTPVGVTTDPDGNVYFVSAELNSVFRIGRDGNLTRLAGGSRAGYPGDGGPATSAQLQLLPLISLARPGGLAVDNAGNLFIADVGNHRIRRISPNGLIVTVAGTGTSGFEGDGGAATDAQLSFPTGVAVDASGSVFIADAGNLRVRKLSTNGIITTVGGNGQCCFSGDGGRATDAAVVPVSLAVDDSGTLFVSDSLRIRRISTSGIVTTVAGSEIATGWLGGVAVDGAGNLLVSSGQVIRKITPGGTVTTVAGSPDGSGFSGDGGPATSARLLNPYGVALDRAGNLFIADAANQRIRKVSPDGLIATVAGIGPGGGSTASPASGSPATRLDIQHPSSVAVDTAGNVFIADGFTIRRVSAAGNVTTIAGTGTKGFSGDGGPAMQAQLTAPYALAVDSAGNVFFSDAGTRVRKISSDGIINTVAGNGTAGFPSGLGDGGQATTASLSGFVAALAIDQGGNLFIADTNTNRIRKVSPDGIIRTVAGGGMNFTDGGLATDAQLGCPSGIVIDGGNDLLISEQCRGVIRKVSPAGIITTFAGSTTFTGRSGDGGPAIGAEIPAPQGLALDRAGNLFIADSYIEDFGPLPCCDERIRKISPDGIITTVAGIGLAGYSGDGGPASAAALNAPTSVAVDGAGNVYVADYFNSLIRLLQPAGRSLLIGAVVDAASQRSAAISPGKIVVVYGAGLGPDQLIQNQANAGRFGTELGGTTVSLNGVAAPILYTSATQVAAIVPYAISRTTAQVVVTYQGQVSNSFSVPAALSAPSIFTANQQGWGQAAAINVKDGRFNSPVNPLQVGDYISLFATGEGQTSPGGVDGKVGGSVSATPLLPVIVTVGGIRAPGVQYAGSVQGQVSGLMQVNVKIPDGVKPSGYVPVVLQVGDVSSTSMVWIAVAGN